MHQVDLVDVERLAGAEDGNDDSEPDGGFRGSHDHHEEAGNGASSLSAHTHAVDGLSPTGAETPEPESSVASSNTNSLTDIAGIVPRPVIDAFLDRLAAAAGAGAPTPELTALLDLARRNALPGLGVPAHDEKAHAIRVA